MKIVAPHFFDVSLKCHHYVYLNISDKPKAPDTFVMNELPELSGELEMVSAKLAYDALEEYLQCNTEIADFFSSSGKMASEDSMHERAFNNINERLQDLLRIQCESGDKPHLDLFQLVAKQMAETTCKVIYTVSMNDKLKTERDKMKEERDTDSLTGLLNRRAFDERLHEAVAKSGRKTPLCMLIVDLDQFKWVNDKYGHPAGDDVLREFAESIPIDENGQRILRASDIFARYGGDEFVLLLFNSNIDQACIVAHRILAALERKTFRVGSNGSAQQIKLSASIGISQYQGKRRDPKGKKMVKQTDHHLFMMKGTRRDRYGVENERRGNIACNGRVLTKDEIDRILKENPDMLFPVDSVMINRSNISTALLAPAV